MFEIYCVTNRELCAGDFLTRIDEIAKSNISGIILREKSLCESEYTLLAKEVLSICKKHDANCILHTHVEAALSLNHRKIHLPLDVLKSTPKECLKRFDTIGASCHSLEDAKYAQSFICTYITAGHIFPTECKKGVPQKGTAFLKNICSNVDIPVFAIGGINKSNIKELENTGIFGFCVMGDAMKSENATSYFDGLKNARAKL